jgi:endonuclease G, mitochondrial
MLIDTNTPQSIVEETQQRYAEREQERENHRRSLSEGKIFQADSSDRVQQRLQRLGVGSQEIQQLLSQETAVAPEDLSDGVALERILQQNNLAPIAYIEQASQVSRSIGRVVIKNARREIEGYGTGFLVSPRLLLTNNHVLTNAESAINSQVEFNYQRSFAGQLLSPTTFDLEPNTFFITDKALDYSLVAVKPTATSGTSLSDFGWLPLIESPGKIIIGEFVNIIQHPNGEPKQIALRENSLIDVLENFLHYQTDTAPGSSGSPVFNDQWEVVALHHSGVPDLDAFGRVKGWKANEGVRISRIVKHIQGQALSATAVTLRTQLFSNQAPPAIPARPIVTPTPTPTPTPRSRPTEQTIPEPTPTAMPPAAAMQWTIPLQVSVSLGQVTMNMPTATPSPVSASPTTPTHRSIEPPPSESELTQLLEEARRSRERPYYDATQDATDRDRYYQSIQIAQLGREKAYRELNQLLTQTHHTKPGYKPSRELYPWIDIRPNRKIQSIYSDQQFEPETLIQEDFRLEQARALRQQELLGRESTLSPEDFDREMDFLEASLGFNCEHVVPQSWFLKKEPMRGDLHHLFACESRCNSFRSNNPYVDFPDNQEKIMDQCGNLSNGEFEPKSGKGSVARATLYFLLRYPGEIDNAPNEYRLERLETLIAWHQQFPVDEYERHRNAAIFARQGNRNPLIDFPDWANLIEFRLGLKRGR